MAELFVSAPIICRTRCSILRFAPSIFAVDLFGGRWIYATMNVARQMGKVSQSQSRCSYMLNYSFFLFRSMRRLNNCVNHFRKWVALNTKRAGPVEVNEEQSNMCRRSENKKMRLWCIYHIRAHQSERHTITVCRRSLAARMEVPFWRRRAFQLFRRMHIQIFSQVHNVKCFLWVMLL